MERVGWFSGVCCFWPGEDGDKGFPFLCLRIFFPCAIKKFFLKILGGVGKNIFFMGV